MTSLTFTHALATLLSCGIFGLSCPAASSTPLSAVSIAESASTSPKVTITTDVNGKKQTKTVDAPYGVASSVVSETKNGKTTTHASTTPLTKADVTKMQQQMQKEQQLMDEQFAAMQKEMNAMFKEQQQLFGSF